MTKSTEAAAVVGVTLPVMYQRAWTDVHQLSCTAAPLQCLRPVLREEYARSIFAEGCTPLHVPPISKMKTDKMCVRSDIPKQFRIMIEKSPVRPSLPTTEGGMI